ncbi:MAG: hypothetical protein A3E82_00600 [Gammaproteobacteria bacterium RIFCSPHIGHO2_12_FULL_38_11]|nr:MAG: hypothetical protein A3E82_00600 [Gammaproteobacteria bacterium RIFCSPHIGHO2_12_FULL_38_11]
MTVTFEHRADLLQSFPCFAALTGKQREILAYLMKEEHFQANQPIVTEGELVDSVFIILEGQAEVTRGELDAKKHLVQVPIAFLNPGEAIGLNDTGFYSATGKRTASVIASGNMILLRLELKDLYEFLKKYHLESSMSNAASKMLRMKLIKQCLPFSKLSHERLQWLANHVEDLIVPAGTVLFTQGDIGHQSYLICSGRIEILVKDKHDKERSIAILKPPALFGEATLITRTPRNATARAVEKSELLVLQHEYLSELLESEKNVAQMFMTLMVDRSRPIQNKHVSVHHRVTADGETLAILKNPDNGRYFKLSKEGEFVWRKLDGRHTLQEITIELAEHLNIFAPDIVVALISKLSKANFINNLVTADELNRSPQSFVVKNADRMKRICNMRYAFGDADEWISRTYNRYVHYLFGYIGQFILISFIIAGLTAFIVSTDDVLFFFSEKHASLILLLLGLLPLGLIGVSLHELGHAYAVKAFGYEVHYMGVGVHWLRPIAFTDTSDMWLATRKPRMFVNLAGIYVDVLVGSLSALFIFLISSPYLQGLLWLFALYSYIIAFRNLNPLQDRDGYYVLMDWIDKTHLRDVAILWLLKGFREACKTPHLFREHIPEVSYWFFSVVFLIFVSIITYIVQAYVLTVLDIHFTNPLFSLIFPLLAVVFSLTRVFIKINREKKGNI